MLGDVYAVNTVIDDDRDLVHVNFGEVIASHLAAVAFVADSARVPVGPSLRDDPDVGGRTSARQDVLPDGEGHGDAARHPGAGRHADRRLGVLRGLRLARVPRRAGSACARSVPTRSCRSLLAKQLRRRRRVADRDAAEIDARRTRAALHDRARRRGAQPDRRRYDRLGRRRARRGAGARAATPSWRSFPKVPMSSRSSPDAMALPPP